MKSGFPVQHISLLVFSVFPLRLCVSAVDFEDNCVGLVCVRSEQSAVS